MKRKYLSKTFLRDVRKYKIRFDFSNDEYVLCVKEMIDCDDFIAIEGHKLICNGSYMIEIMPKAGNYMMRAYLDNDKNVLEYYFDIVSNKGIDETTKMPFYDDLYLDVVVGKRGMLLCDKDELDKAYEEKEVSKELYDLAINEADALMKEIEEGTNKYKNMDLKELI